MAVAVPEPGFSLKEASVICGIPRSSFYQLVKEQKIPTYKGRDGMLKVSRLDLQLFLNERERMQQWR